MPQNSLSSFPIRVTGQQPISSKQKCITLSDWLISNLPPPEYRRVSAPRVPLRLLCVLSKVLRNYTKNYYCIFYMKI